MQCTDLSKGDVLKGTLSNTVNTGRFVELAPGVDGLILHSTIEAGGWADASELGRVGAEIRVHVLYVNAENHTVRLCPSTPGPAGLRSEEDRFARIREEVGKIVPGRLLQPSALGRFVDLGYGLDGVVTSSHLNALGLSAHELGPLGERMEFVVSHAYVETGKRRIRLQLTPELERKYRARQHKDIEAPRLEFVIDGSNVIRGTNSYAALGRLRQHLAATFAGSCSSAIVDASLVPVLRNDLEDPDGADQLVVDVLEGRVEEEPGGRDADVTILHTARDRNAIVVSRDWFRDYPELRAGVRLLAWKFDREEVGTLSTATVHDKEGNSVSIPLLPEAR